MPTLSLKLSKEVYEKLERVAKEKGVTVYQLVKELVISFARGNTQQTCSQGDVDVAKLSRALEYLENALGWFSDVHDDVERVFKIVKELYEEKLLELNVALTLAHKQLSEFVKGSGEQDSEGASHAQAVDMAR